MICKKHQINMNEVNGRLVCPMCEKGIPGDVVFFEKNRAFGTIIEKGQRISDSNVKRRKANGDGKENSGEKR